ncbi:MFS transporter, partial [Lacticaseibacillus paracasei]
FFLVMLAYFHNNVGGPFAVFAVFAVLSMFFVHYLVPETRGKSLEEIEMDLRHQAK